MACGGDAIIVDDEGVSSGGVKLEVIEPPRGTIVGGNNVLLEGEGLGGNNVVVAFGDIAAEEVIVLSASALLVVAPPGLSPGPVDVVVANAQGFAQRNAAYTYNDPPAIAAIDPPAGPRQGGTTVLITGSGFSEFEAGDNAVTFDGEPADAVEVVSDTELSVVSPPGIPFARADVEVVNANGAAALEDAFLYEANGLFASAANPSSCGNSRHEAAFVFVDLDDLTVVDIGTDRPDGFTRLASDGGGKLVGLEGCTQDVYEINTDTGETTLAVDTEYDFNNGRHIGGLVRDGNDYLVRNPADITQLARLSTSTGEIVAVGAPQSLPANKRGGFYRVGSQVFYAGLVSGAAANTQGIAEIDVVNGTQIGQAVPLPFTIHGAAAHRGEVFVANRISFGEGSNNFAIRLLAADPATGEVEFRALVPIYVKGLASGDL